MHTRIPTFLRYNIQYGNSSNLDSFSSQDQTFTLNDDVVLSFGSLPSFYKARITSIHYLKDLKVPNRMNDQSKKIRKKTHTKSKLNKMNLEQNSKWILKYTIRSAFLRLKKLNQRASIFNEISNKKSKKMVALLVEVQFYFSMDDLPDIDEDFTNAKELFLCQKKHLVYGYNLISKCVISKKPPIKNETEGFFCWRGYDPHIKSIVQKN